MIVLGIESTCDETSCGIVEDGKRVLANVTNSQIKEHLPYDGVVPEIASRVHLQKIIPVIQKALKEAKLELSQVDLIACCNRPGLIGGLIIGTATAKALSWILDKPFIAINHIEAHLYSPHLTFDIDFPYIGLLVSGGHTLIVIARSYTEYEVVGTTIDDAVGEAFDKVAKHYNMGYPGGPNVEKLAKDGDENRFNFPISNLYKTKRLYDVSYSGIKTACINYLEKYLKKEKTYTINDIAASFQKKAFDMLFKKVKKVVFDYKIDRVVVAGGVSANMYLRKLFQSLKKCKVYFPDLKYSTDNGAMVAGFAYHKYLKDGPSKLDIGVFARVEGYRNVT